MFQGETLALLALSYKQTRDHVALIRLPLSFGKALKTHDQCNQSAVRLDQKEHCFILGQKGMANQCQWKEH
jgi:hypothetical protein